MIEGVSDLHAVSGRQVSMYNSLASQIFHSLGNLYRYVQQFLLDANLIEENIIWFLDPLTFVTRITFKTSQVVI